jgi:hypothetical protein
MAEVKEMGLAIAAALASEHGPNPMPVSFRGQTLSEAGAIILAVLRECRDAEVKLARLEVDPDLFKEIELGVDVPLQSSAELNGEVRFWR